MEVALARERQELARANIANSKLEQRIIELEQTRGQDVVNNENSLKVNTTLKFAKGEDGQCKRCEAFVIANGVQIQKIKVLKTENTKLRLRIKETQPTGCTF